jgi:hypothetical protein
MSVVSADGHGLLDGLEQQQQLHSILAPCSAGSKSAWAVQQEDCVGASAADALCSDVVDDEDYRIGTQVADGGSAECYQLFEDGMVSVRRTTVHALPTSVAKQHYMQEHKQCGVALQLACCLLNAASTPCRASLSWGSWPHETWQLPEHTKQLAFICTQHSSSYASWLYHLAADCIHRYACGD